MDLQSRKRQKKAETEQSVIFLPEELITEVLSFLPVKSVTQLKCLSKSYNTLISDHKFIKLHLNRFSQKADRTLITQDTNRGSVSFTAIHMPENTPPYNITTFIKYPDTDKDRSYVVGSCNGLLCLCGFSFVDGYFEWFFRFWNPSTQKISKKIGSFRDPTLGFKHLSSNFTLGYDKSKDTFKLVRFFPKTKNVTIFCLTDNVWRNIQNSPAAYYNTRTSIVNLSGSVNWLAICNYFSYSYYHKDISIEKFAIISLDLGTETHTKLLPPKGFNEVPFTVPLLSVLKDCLCFSHDFKQTHFIVWRMKEFGVEESWTQLLKVSYHNLKKDYYHFDHGLVYLWEKNDTLLYTYNYQKQAILCNWRDNRAERVNEFGLFNGLDYVESLVSYC